MGWSIVIGEGGSAFTLDAHAKFDLQARVVDNENGSVNYIEFFIEVEGDVIASTPALVASGINGILSEAVEKLTPRRIQIKLDGTTKFDFKPEQSIGSPRITYFKTVPDDGNADSHWRYAFSIYVKQPATDIAELSTSIYILTENGIVTKKVWKASCKASTLSKALSKVLTFKPAEKFTKQEIERFFQENRANATWTWEATKKQDKKILSFDETITITGAGRDYVDVQQIDPKGLTKVSPRLHLARGKIIEVRIRGTARGLTNGVLSPLPHFTESATMKRAFAREINSFVRIEDEKLGIFAVDYEEIWLATDHVPNPNHHGHEEFKFDIAPADGGIAAS